MEFFLAQLQEITKATRQKTQLEQEEIKKELHLVNFEVPKNLKFHFMLVFVEIADDCTREERYGKMSKE